jgi:hypothetical protein
MATPVVSGVAALIKSLYPAWNPQQIASQLLATADNIDSTNPGYEGQLGAGRINAAAAIGPEVMTPQVIAVSGIGAAGGAVSFLDAGDVIGIQFSHVMDAVSVLDDSNYQLVYLGPDGLDGGGDDVLIPLTMLTTTYDAFPGRGVQLSVGATGVAGNYELRVSGLSSSDGALLGSFVRGFNRAETPPIAFQADATVDDFEDGNTTEYTEQTKGGSSRKSNASAASVAARDGEYGLEDATTTGAGGWLYRDDVVVEQGDVISVWIQSTDDTPYSGRAYFGFGASSQGTLSMIMGRNTGSLVLQRNAGYGYEDLASAPQAWRADRWYRFEIEWRTTDNLTPDGNNIIGRLYDKDGATLLNTIEAYDDTISSGGIAFRAFDSTKYYDTVEVGHRDEPAASVAIAAALDARPFGHTQSLQRPSRRWAVNDSQSANAGLVAVTQRDHRHWGNWKLPATDTRTANWLADHTSPPRTRSAVATDAIFAETFTDDDGAIDDSLPFVAAFA